MEVAKNTTTIRSVNNKHMAQQTAVELLFLDFKALSKNMRDSGDDPSANLIDYLCIKEHEAKEMEKKQIMDAYVEGINLVPCDLNSTDELDAEKYYNETFVKS